MPRVPAKPRKFKARNLTCPYPTCRSLFKNASGRTQHMNAMHACTFAPAPRAPVPAPDEIEHQHDFEEGQPGQLHDAIAPDGDNEQHEIAQNEQRETRLHPHLTGRPCRKNGHFLPPDSEPEPEDRPPPTDFSPYNNRPHFELADFLFRKDQMSGAKIDELMGLWAATLPEDQDPPFADHKDLYETIDDTPLGGVKWESFTVSYTGVVPDVNPPAWMSDEYTVWYRCPRQVLLNQLSNPDFAHEMDYTPKQVYGTNNKREYKDFMSGNWAWKQADILAEDPANEGATFCPVILGSDKTTVSVGTGHTEYYPLYLSNGLVHNNARRAHRNAVSVIAFLAIPKTDQEHQNLDNYRTFRRRLFHTSLRFILHSLRPGMTEAEIVRCADGHYRRMLYGLGPYIADYPEQALLACIVQGWCPKCTAPHDDLDSAECVRRSHEHTEALLEAFNHATLWNDYGVISDLTPFTVDFPRADIYELISPDLLHQVIKGTFKDHLVDWVVAYIEHEHSASDAAAILADIDRRIAATPSFPGLRNFEQGRGFKQWTGDDSKGLMKVFLPAIAGHVPEQMLRAVSAFMEFCYIARRNVIDEHSLDMLDDALERFHRDREIFRNVGVRPTGFSLPRQHSLKHYRPHIQLFGALNGLCSSITESKHIKAVKEPWRRSSRFNAIGQMLLTNQRLDKLAAARMDFTARGMLNGPCVRLPRAIVAAPEEHAEDMQDEQEQEDNDAAAAAAAAIAAEDDDEGDVDGPTVLGEVVLAKGRVRGLPSDVEELADVVGHPRLPELIRRFLFEQVNPGQDVSGMDVPLEDCPEFSGRVSIFPSAVATYYAPSDMCGVGGMHRERIRSVQSWRRGPPRRDCAFIERDANLPGFRGLHAVRVLLFMSLKYNGRLYPCALVSWFSPIDDVPCPDTGMWIVEPDVDQDGTRSLSVVHIDCFLRGAHLIGVPAGDTFLPVGFQASDSLDAFQAFYVNKYADHHSHEIAF
ncbi:hypothetical protein BV25DRAFT_1873266 [Artomyces pyxidatus]|uniref:Uncharacterized protein n=1 Tax=Artomyces pyxidatus TaxID=48021 RepID=A0ACB8SFN0_9AGAM|nr:hypothetical protein BV25DRAFT_1873266 [Artomyces pyxidatus]